MSWTVMGKWLAKWLTEAALEKVLRGIAEHKQQS